MFYKLLIFIFTSCFLFSCRSDDGPKPYIQTGEASYYADVFEGRETANGEIYRKDSLTAAHRTLPFGTVVAVKNLDNSKSVKVKINDRGPYAKNRIIDLSLAAAKKLDMLETGTADIKLKVVKAAPGYSVSDSTTTDLVNPENN